MNSDTTAERVTEEAEGVVSGPWEGAGCEDEEDLGDVEAFVMGEVTDAVSEATTE